MTDYVSTKSFLVLQRDSIIANETSGVELPQREIFSDYRQVDGVMIPFKMVSNNIANGDIVLLVKDVKWNVEIPDTLFHKPGVIADIARQNRQSAGQSFANYIREPFIK